ncbi:MAG: hypothetical protein RSF83_10005 [Hungatella sp.]
MSIAKISRIAESCRYFTIALEPYEGSTMDGMIFHDSSRMGIAFHSFLEMAEQMEQISVHICFPAIAMNDRYFQKTEKSSVESGIEGRMWQPPYAMENHDRSFWQVTLDHRCNATWQGHVKRQEDDTWHSYGSFLELMKLMHETLTHKNHTEEGFSGDTLRSLWGMETVASQNEASLWVSSSDANFHIQVLFRENQTWQGILRWQEKRREIRFRSFLELWKLMEEAREETREDAVYGSRRYAAYPIAGTAVNQVFNNKRRIR